MERGSVAGDERVIVILNFLASSRIMLVRHNAAAESPGGTIWVARHRHVKGLRDTYPRRASSPTPGAEGT
jgi:hypothetical protein